MKMPLLGSILKKPMRAKVRLYKAILNLILRDQDILKHLDVEYFNEYGINASLVSDYYSPLPVVSDLEKNLQRWFNPSELVGLHYNLDEIKGLLLDLKCKYLDEYKRLPGFKENKKKGYGPGFGRIDAMLLYFMLRDIQPEQYIEIGSGLSTYYCSLALEQNSREAKPFQITCIEPNPYESLYNISEINVVKSEVQDIDISIFQQLNTGDILFIDSTHIIKIDGDVPYLFLEVIPRLKRGVIIHVHDVHFPYNVPFPPNDVIFSRPWPRFWNEAMLLQAFLSYNDSYKIKLSLPLIRHFDEEFLQTHIPEYTSLNKNSSKATRSSAISSMWLEKIR